MTKLSSVLISKLQFTESLKPLPQPGYLCVVSFITDARVFSVDNLQARRFPLTQCLSLSGNIFGLYNGDVVSR